MTIKGLLVVALTASLLLLPTIESWAIEGTGVLPKGIYSPMIRYGLISSIGQRFTATGQLHSLADLYTVEFDVGLLASQNSEVNDLVTILNQFGNYELGSQLHLGYLKPDIQPEVSYIAPVMAYGLTDKLSFAVGFPVIHYKNQVSFVQQGSNLPQLRQQFAGTSPELDSAFDQLSLNLVTATQSTLMQSGYRPLASRDSWFMGDIQLAGLYQAFKNSRWASLYKAIVNLPTGPKDDPDDLLDLDAFGQSAVEIQSLLQHTLTRHISVIGKLGFRWNMADQIQKRVPESGDDILPGIHTKENVDRDIGDIVTAEVRSIVNAMESLDFEAGISHSQKSADSYTGSRGSRYDLLSANTRSSWNNFILGAELNTVKAYQAKKIAVPYIVSYYFNDIFRAVNKERQTLHELTLQIFF